MICKSMRSGLRMCKPTFRYSASASILVGHNEALWCSMRGTNSLRIFYLEAGSRFRVALLTPAHAGRSLINIIIMGGDDARLVDCCRYPARDRYRLRAKACRGGTAALVLPELFF